MTQSNLTSKTENEIEEIPIIPSECYITKDHSLYSKIENFLIGELPNAYHDILKARIYNGQGYRDIRIYQLVADKSFLFKFQETQKFLSPVEISVYLREFQNRSIQNLPKDKSHKVIGLNFITDLNCDTRLISTEIKAHLTDEKLVELGNIGIQQQSAKLMSEKSFQEQMEDLKIMEAMVNFAREQIGNRKVRELDKIKISQNEKYAQERLDKANGIKTSKSGKILKVKSQTNSNIIQNLTAKFGSSKVNYWTKILKLNIEKISMEELEQRSKQFDLINEI